MFDEVFGISDVSVKFDGKLVSVGDETISLEDIAAVFMRNPDRKNKEGFLILSELPHQDQSSLEKEIIVPFIEKDYRNVEKLFYKLNKPVHQGYTNKELRRSGVRRAFSQFRQEVNNVTAKKCPSCKSTNIQFVENKRKGFSIGKAVGGSLLAGSTGSLAGFAGKKGKKSTWHCMDCGHAFALKS